MSGVNNAKDYYTIMGFAHEGSDGAPVITDSLLQGGIVSVYYLGTLVGALVGGIVGDKYGRIKAIAFGSVWAILGASLQASAQNHVWMICVSAKLRRGKHKEHPRSSIGFLSEELRCSFYQLPHFPAKLLTILNRLASSTAGEQAY